MRPDYIPPQPPRGRCTACRPPRLLGRPLPAAEAPAAPVARWRQRPRSHRSGRRPAGHDGAAGRRIMMRGRRIRLIAIAVLLAMATSVVRLRRMAWAELVAAAGDQGNGPGVVHHPGADARRGQPRNRTRGCGSATSRSATSPRSSARAGTRCSPSSSTAMSNCPPMRPPRSARPACWDRCTSNWRRRPTCRPEGRLHQGSLIPLSSGKLYPTTEQTLAAVSLLLNGGGLGQVQDITQAFSTAFDRSRRRPAQPARATGHLHRPRQRPDRRHHRRHRQPQQPGRPVRRAEAGGRQGLDRPFPTRWRCSTISATTSSRRSTNSASSARWPPTRSTRPKTALVHELKDLGPVLESLANAGPALTRSLSFFATFPFPKETLTKWFRGDYANLSADRRPDIEPARRRRCSPAPGGRAI